MAGFSYKKINEQDRTDIIDIFNWYIENTFAAYPENKVPYDFYDNFLSISQKYPSLSVRNEDGIIVGFGMLRPYSPMPSFAHTAEITYFIKPEFTGQGIGKEMLLILEDEGKKLGILRVLAGISSKNQGSIRFHEKKGFKNCGVFPCVCKKKGEFFDEVWMYKVL